MVSKSRNFNRLNRLNLTELSRLCRLAECCMLSFPQTSVSSKLATRVAEAGFEKVFDPSVDGKCFYYAASSQIGFSPSTLTAVIFEYLKNHHFDVSNWFFMAIFGQFHSGDAKRLFRISSVWSDCLDAPYLHDLNGLHPYILNLDHPVQAISTYHLSLPSSSLNMRKHFDQSNHLTDR